MDDSKTVPGAARCPGVCWDDLAVADKNPVPEFLLGQAYSYLGSEPIPVERYVSPEYHRRELDRLWPRVWQFAAREEEFLAPGDTVVYENAGRSYLLVRQADGSIDAFHNVCLHRGRRLRDRNGSASEFRCPYHGFTWNLDGSLKSIPCRWDFPHLESQSMSLPRAQVARWQGYVFIREEARGPSIEEYLGPLVQHFQHWRHDECYTSAWVAKVVPANWKACAEAFMEAFHVNATHPQIMPFTGDANSKYYVWGDHVNLMITPFGISSPHMADQQRDEQWLIDQFVKYNGRVVAAGTTITVPAGETARRAMGDFNRKRFGDMAGRDFSHLSDSEVQDAFTYNIFPNFSPWGGFAPNVVYRWRPWPDQDNCMMEVRVLTRLKPGEPRKPSVPMTLLGPDDSWEGGLGQLGAVLMQDMKNLPAVQLGMKSSKTGFVNLSNYQEVRIRHFHHTLEKYLATP
jgi:phenylpropionate dioxygenase-like ring-hydroxylating dioxygenase large terminal subunit